MDHARITKFISAYLACLDLYGLGSTYFETRYPKKKEFVDGLKEMFSPNEMDMYIKAAAIAPFTKEELKAQYTESDFDFVFQKLIGKSVVFHYVNSKMKSSDPPRYLTYGALNHYKSGFPVHQAVHDYLYYVQNVGYQGEKISWPLYQRKYRTLMSPAREEKIHMGVELRDTRAFAMTDDVIEHLKKHTAFALTSCSCRMIAEDHGEPCKNPGYCLMLGENAETWAATDPASLVTLEEAIEYIQDASRRGLYFMTDNVLDEAGVICSCCDCCCGLMKALQRGETHQVMPSKYLPRVKKSLCIACGECVQHCPTHTIQLKDGAIEIGTDCCVGCGHCAERCAQNAIDLVVREDYDFLNARYHNVSELVSNVRAALKDQKQSDLT